MAGLELPPARVDIRTYAHDLELSSLVVELEREFGPERARTEREMRAADTGLGTTPTKRPRFAVPLVGTLGQLRLTPAGQPRLHFPDCAVVGASAEAPKRVLAVELERTAKGRARLRRILAGYVGAGHIGSVRYYAVGGRVRDLLEHEVGGRRAHGLIEIRDRLANGHSKGGLDTAA